MNEMKFTDFLQENKSVPRYSPPQYKEELGILVSREEDVVKWLRANKKKIVNIKSSDIKKIESRLKSAKPVQVRPGYSDTFKVYKGQLHSIVEYGPPGMNRTITLSNIATGKEITIDMDLAKGFGRTTFVYGISDAKPTTTGFATTVRLNVEIITTVRHDTPTLITTVLDTKATDEINLDAIKKLYSDYLSKPNNLEQELK